MLIVETGYFSLSWAEMATNLGIKVETFAADWRKGADIAKLAERLAKDKAHEIKAVLCVHNETATGMVLPVADIRRALDETKHPALLLSDTISSLASIEYKMDAWGIDVTVGGSQKGLMLPTGMSFTGVSNKALDVARKNKAPRHYFHWELMDGRAPQKFMGTAPVHMFFGLQEVAQDARGGRPRRGVRAPCPPRRRDARRGARLGCGRQGPAALRPVARPALQLGDHGDHARGHEFRPAAQGRRSIATTCRSAAGWGR